MAIDVENKPLPEIVDRYGLDSLGIGQQLHGDLRVGNKGTGEVLMDGTNNRILISDETYPRILMGFQENGF